jgi:hypothetical protein
MPRQRAYVSTTVPARTPHASIAPAGAAVPGIFPPLPRARDRVPALSRAYKWTQSTPRSSTPSPLLIPALLSSSSPRNRPNSGSLLRRDSKEIGPRWRRRRCQAKESSCRCHSAASPMTPASSPSSPPSSSFPCQRRWAPGCPEVDDGRGPLDSNPVAAYRFGKISGPDQWDPHVRFKNQNSPARLRVIGPARSGFLKCGPGSVKFRPVTLLFSRPFSN